MLKKYAKGNQASITFDKIHDRFTSIKDSGYPLSFIFFIDQKGEERNIIFNNGSYFELLDNKKFYRLCPLSEVCVWINKIRNGKFRLVGQGHLKKTLLVNRKTLLSRNEAIKYMKQIDKKVI